MSKRIITINRMYGSNGRRIGRKLAQELGIHFYDKELILLASEKRGIDIPYEELVKLDETRASSWRYPVDDQYQMEPKYRHDPLNDVLFAAEKEVIQEIAQKEDCVIVGRCANDILEGQCRSVYIYAPLEKRIETVVERAKTDEKTARALIKKMDKQRRIFYNYYTDKKWNDMEQYDLCIDSSKFTDEEIVTMLASMYAHIS